MSDNLIDKKIKINGKSFQVVEHFTTGDENDEKEIIVLAKTISTQPNIFSMGYKDIDDIKISKADLKLILKYFEEHTSNHETIKIASVASDGKIITEEIKIVSRSFLDSNKILVDYNSELKIIDLQYLAKSFYLLQLLKTDKKKTEPKATPLTIDELFAKAMLKF
jgi:hypothetical protein